MAHISPAGSGLVDLPGVRGNARAVNDHAHAYRPDIDGMRAVAVSAVVIYHVWPNWFPGGFVGVDIFFVISGFLITSIILRQLETGSFSLGDFYARRVRRIFPALILVLAATLGFGWLTTLQGEFLQLGKHALAGTTFVANLVQWSEAGYFDNDALTKPLLHLWSLGVEEQFYIAWPLILWAVVAARWRFLRVAAAIFIASMLINVVTVNNSPVAAFFSPLSRFWELMSGGVVAHLLMHHGARLVPYRRVLSWGGALLLVLAFALTRAHMLFPGWWALLPVGGTCALILAGQQAPLNQLLLGRTWPVRLGLISYPLYLWHWPLLAFGYLIVGQKPAIGVKVGLVAAALALSILTYRLLELPLRRRAGQARVMTGLVLAMCAVAGWSLAISTSTLRPRIEARGASAYLAALNESEFPSPGMEAMHYQGALFQKVNGGSGRTTVYLGDSVMQQFSPRITAQVLAQPARFNTVIFATAGGCPPLPDTIRLPKFRFPLCTRTVNAAFALANSAQTETVVIGAAWYGYFNSQYQELLFDNGKQRLAFPAAAAQNSAFDALERSLRTLRSNGKRVVLVLQPPAGKEYDPRSMFAGSRFDEIRPLQQIAAFDRYDFEQRHAQARARLIAIAARSGASVIDPADHMCQAGRCPVLDRSGEPLYTDSVHLRPGYTRSRVAFLDATAQPAAAAAPAAPARAP